MHRQQISVPFEVQRRKGLQSFSAEELRNANGAIAKRSGPAAKTLLVTFQFLLKLFEHFRRTPFLDRGGKGHHLFLPQDPFSLIEKVAGASNGLSPM